MRTLSRKRVRLAEFAPGRPAPRQGPVRQRARTTEREGDVAAVIAETVRNVPVIPARN
jgi:hypothetical protein